MSNRYFVNQEEDGEDDFMSDKFLVEATAVAAKEPKSYAQRRKEALKRSEEKGFIKSRAEREREAREQGLKRNLMMPATTSNDNDAGKSSTTQSTKEGTSQQSNKALDMMIKMGFKPGEALGRKTTSIPSSSKTVSLDNSDEDDALATRGGIGSSKSAGAASGSTKSGMGTKRAAPTADPPGDFISLNDPSEGEDDEEKDPNEPPPSRPGYRAAMANSSGKGKGKEGVRIDPLEIKMRTGRGGLGVEEAKRRKLSSAAAASSSRSSLSLEDYRSRTSSNRDERRAYGLLSRARQTCSDLDLRNNVKSNYLWLDPEEEYQRRRSEYLDQRRFGPKSRLGDFGNEEGDEDNLLGDDQVGEIEISPEGDEEVFEDAELQEREERKEEFLKADARERLRQTVAYLRQRYSYCMWCGAQYGDNEELASECPGEAEDDH